MSSKDILMVNIYHGKEKHKFGRDNEKSKELMLLKKIQFPIEFFRISPSAFFIHANQHSALFYVYN